MQIVFATHDGSSKEYLFEVPEGMSVKRNDVLCVETMNGPKVAVATGGMSIGEYTDRMLIKMGAYLPLKKVIACANKEIQEYIKNRAITKAIVMLRQEIEPDIPF